LTQLDPAFWLARCSIPTLEIAAHLGYRMVIIDMEHGAITGEACDSLVAQGKALGFGVIVRVAEASRVLVQQALDRGADGVMLPMIRDAAHAAEAAGFAKYPPLGTRGVGSGRAFAFGAYTAVSQNFHGLANAHTRCHLMIETVKALEEVDAIAALATVDGLFIGPSDLSLARGRGTFRFTAEDEADFRLVAAACRRHGKTLGLPTPSAKACRFAKAVGAGYVTLSDDLTALRSGLASGLGLLEERQEQA
jgi:2-dehydro-3-deoxyglucarate aldolase/4-hydroxy-2-oxoheptanedioate aldolase